LWIEIDDKSHDRKWEQDEIRTQYLNKLWIKILRYRNDNIYYQLDSVIIDLNTRLKERENELLLTNCLPSNEGNCSEEG
jgi:very-short-patch-repair endonuclease